jgi:hypothetical protein
MVSILVLGLALTFQPPPPEPPPAPPEPRPPATYRMTGTRVAIGQDVQIAADEEILDGVVVVGGSLTVDGRIREGAVVVGGDVRLTSKAEVNGDLVLVGGTLIRDPGSRISGGINYISIGDWWRSLGLLSWSSRVPEGIGGWISLSITLFRLALLSVLAALVLVVARAPVARVGRAAAAEPVRAAVIGLAAEVLFLPVLLVCSVALGITVIGLPLVFILIPLACVVACAAMLLGFTALSCRLGEWLEDRLGWRPRSAFLATALGMLVIVLPTLIARILGVGPAPLGVAAFAVLATGAVAEFLVWTIGLGAALMTGFGRWNTAPPPLEHADLTSPHAGLV